MNVSEIIEKYGENEQDKVIFALHHAIWLKNFLTSRGITGESLAMKTICELIERISDGTWDFKWPNTQGEIDNHHTFSFSDDEDHYCFSYSETYSEGEVVNNKTKKFVFNKQNGMYSETTEYQTSSYDRETFLGNFPIHEKSILCGSTYPYVGGDDTKAMIEGKERTLSPLKSEDIQITELLARGHFVSPYGNPKNRAVYMYNIYLPSPAFEKIKQVHSCYKIKDGFLINTMDITTVSMDNGFGSECSYIRLKLKSDKSSKNILVSLELYKRDNPGAQYQQVIPFEFEDFKNNFPDVWAELNSRLAYLSGCGYIISENKYGFGQWTII